MKKLSIKTKICIGVSLFVIMTALLSSGAVIYFSNHVTQNTMRRNLIMNVEANINEISFYKNKSDVKMDDEFDILVEGHGFYIEIDDDFTKEYNGITTTLYGNGSVLYGEGTVNTDETPLEEIGIRSVNSHGSSYYIYDKKIKSNIGENLWLRGTISKEISLNQMLDVIDSYLFIIPLMVVFAVGGSFIIAKRTLKPIDEISQSADTIRLGNDLTKRLEIEGNAKELDTLILSFNGMLERLEESFEREKRFSSDISHELRTPVSVILSASELALEENDEEEYRESLELVKRQGEKMRQMINGMLEFTRLGKEGLSYEIIDFSELVRHICDEMSIIQNRHITLLYEVEEDIHVYGDKGLLIRLCENLISNAYKYGKEKGMIQVSLVNEGNQAKLSVKDDGIGIPEEELDKIFDTFYRAGERLETGFGLGLSFVKKIAQLHEGDIQVNSREGIGSTFIYTQKTVKSENL